MNGENAAIAAHDVLLRGKAERGEVNALDATYHLFAALNKHMGNLHEASWLSIKGLRHWPNGDVIMSLRVQGDTTPFTELQGEVLEVGAMAVRVTDTMTYPVEPHSVLCSPYVVIAPCKEDAHPESAQYPGHRWWKSDDAFKAAVGRHLDHMGVRAEVTIGRMVVRNVAGHRVGGWPVLLSGLSNEDSVKVQVLGIGGRRRLGAGIFSRWAP